ncbi:MAG: choice-of-anchor D domain-containing protein [Bryobacteraceae bacterium]|nr:choice-of-anchor D domain-containing protein [Bryobacteraceae bacterium]
MTARLAAIGLWAASLALGQLHLFRIDAPGSEQPVGSSLDVGRAAAGDILDTKLRIRNKAEEEAITLTRFRVRGAGFSLEAHPSIPYIMAAGTNVDFRVRFRPPSYGSYSATLEINDISVLIFGDSPATATLSIEEEGKFRVLQTDEPIVLGRVERGKTLPRRFRLENASSAELTVSSLTIAAGPFDSSGLPPAPLKLKPGAVSDFVITYQPQKAGIHRANFKVDDRVFVLEAVAFDPPFPAPEIVLESQALRSGQQSKVSVRFASSPFGDGTGELRIEFQPSVEGAGDDPAILFVSGGSRTVPVNVTMGETAAKLGGEPEAVFQTGSTAGTITFVVSLGAHLVRASATVAAAPVAIDSASWQRNASSVEVQAQGLDNSRSTSEVKFTFYDNRGRVLAAQPIRAFVTAAFRDYFATSQVGGMFSLTALFPVTGDPAQLGAVEVEFVNSAGTSEKRRIQ